MKSRTILYAAIAASLGLSSAAFAQEYGNQDRDHRGDQRWEQRNDQRAQGHDNRYDNRMGNRGYEERAYNAHEWHRGDRLPSEYRNRQYVVNDWRGHRLSAPPRGYQWVQVGNDYVLAAIATGIIANLIINQ